MCATAFMCSHVCVSKYVKWLYIYVYIYTYIYIYIYIRVYIYMCITRVIDACNMRRILRTNRDLSKALEAWFVTYSHIHLTCVNYDLFYVNMVHGNILFEYVLWIHVWFETCDSRHNHKWTMYVYLRMYIYIYRYTMFTVYVYTHIMIYA